jgi:hypothetical protein
MAQTAETAETELGGAVETAQRLLPRVAQFTQSVVGTMEVIAQRVDACERSVEAIAQRVAAMQTMQTMQTMHTMQTPRFTHIEDWEACQHVCMLVCMVVSIFLGCRMLIT